MTALHTIDDGFALVWRVELQDGRRGRSGQRANDRRRSVRRFLFEHATHARRRIAGSCLARTFDAGAFGDRVDDRRERRYRKARACDEADRKD